MHESIASAFPASPTLAPERAISLSYVSKNWIVWDPKFWAGIVNFFYLWINYYCTILDPAYSHPLPQPRFYKCWCMFMNENMHTRLYRRWQRELNTWSTHFEEAEHNIPLARLSARTRITQGKHGADAVIIFFGQYILAICAFFLHNWPKCTYFFVKNVC